MPVQFQCPNCAQNLRIGDEWAGKQVSCPMCKEIIDAPAAGGGPTRSQADLSPQDQYRVTCGQCGKSIRVPLEMAGKKGACPRCKTAFVIPHPVSGSAQGSQAAPDPNFDPLADFDPLGGVDPLPPQQPGPWQQPAAPASPYAPQGTPVQGQYYAPQQQFRQPVRAGARPPTRKPGIPGPVLVTKIVGVLIILIAVGNGIFHALSALQGFSTSPAEMRQQMQMRQMEDIDPTVIYALMILAAIFMLAYNGFLGFCGMMMFSLQNWGVALAGSIMALIPCACPTWFVSFPVGIVGIVMLCQRIVRDHFK